MKPLPPFDKSYPIEILPYQTRWPLEFEAIAGELRQYLGTWALRIDHIGSTSVPDLAAKDIIDLQITVADLADPGLSAVLESSPYPFYSDYSDAFLAMPADSPELKKYYLKSPPGQRKANIHIREAGRFNQRYALLFRDYLRNFPDIRAAYATLKERMAQIFPDSIDGYLYLKDPLMDMIYLEANDWAERTGWKVDVYLV